jgi:hypothetical protein
MVAGAQRNCAREGVQKLHEEVRGLLSSGDQLARTISRTFIKLGFTLH